MKTEKKVMITSALPYIHGIPHLGNIVGSVLPADVYHRYLEHKDLDNIYICASDSHGTMYEIEAQKRGVSTKKFVYGQHEKVKKLFSRFNIDFTYYGITDSDKNRQTTERIYEKLDENGYIKEKTMVLPYCLNDERFLADRWVEGICPECDGLARGDQCDDCGILLDPKELIEPYCVHCGKREIEFRESNHLFFKLNLFEDWLKTWTEGRCKTKVTKNETLSWLNKGLEERCISRDSYWGFPIPREDYKDKVFYVWFDAPIGYIGATRSWAEENDEDWKNWWLDTDVQYVQFMGKDNILFHTIIFPAMLQGTEEGWNLVDDVVASAFLMSKDVKFSKSRGKGINLESAFEIAEPKYWRYALMSMYPRDDDHAFSLDLFRSKVNSDLNDSFGNFVHRTLKFIINNNDGIIPDVSFEDEIKSKVCMLVEEIDKHYTNYEFRQCTKKIAKLSSLGNEYFQSNEPWKLPDEGHKKKKVLKVCANIVKSLAIVSEPIMPSVAEDIWNMLNIDTDIHTERWDRAKDLDELDGKKIKDPEPLFEKIDTEKLEKVNEKYSDTVKKGGEDEMISFDEFQNLDIRIGEIKSVEDIEKSDNLFKMIIDVGGELKQSVGGFKKHYTTEELEGKKVTVLVNLEPSELMGVESECMVLAGVVGDDRPIILSPEEDVEPGTKVT